MILTIFPKRTAPVETPKKAASTPRASSKLSRAVGVAAQSQSDSAASPSRSVNSTKPRSLKIATPPPTDTQLSLVQEHLKKAKEHIELIEKDKENAIADLKEAQRLSEEANDKLREALAAQKRAQDDSEIDKFRAVELEQAGIEATQKKEAEWEKELHAVRNQHALDLASLLSTTQELQRLKQELTMTCDAKNQALSHADDATKIAEIHAEKVEILSAELTRLKGLLESKQEIEISENSKLVLQLGSEVKSRKQQLEKAKVYETLMEKETSIERLNIDLESAKMTESYAHSIVEEWKIRVEDLEMQVKEANKADKSASESLDSVMKQLERNHELLHDAESEIISLQDKVSLLETTIVRHIGDLEESERSLGITKEVNQEMTEMVESFKAELETVKDEKLQALSNEKFAASSVQSLLDEKNKLIKELEHSRDEEEKSKKAMETLASALHEVSTEAREAKEKLLTNQLEHESFELQIEDLKMVLKATNEKNETIIDDGRHEIHLLRCKVDKCKIELQDAKADWEQKELRMVNSVKHSEEENSSMEKEINRLLNLLKSTEEEACAMKEEEEQLRDSMKEVESEVICLQEALAEAKTENMRLKESMLDKENEFQNVIHENEELQIQEAAFHNKVEELSKLLDALAKKQVEKNDELTDSEKEYDLLPNVVEFSEENGHGREERLKLELPPPQCLEPKSETLREDNTVPNGKATEYDTLNGKPKEDDSVQIEYKMWGSCKIEKREFLPEREQEPFEEEVDSKVDGDERLDEINELNSTESVDPSKQQQKKKKPLLRKFGSLLKKKGTSDKSSFRPFSAGSEDGSGKTRKKKEKRKLQHHQRGSDRSPKSKKWMLMDSPHDSMEFDSHEAAYDYYKAYAKSVGFGTAKLSSRRSRASKEFIDAKFSCIRYGNKQQSDDAVNPRPSPKIGCKASMHVKRRPNGTWYVYSYVKDHNHELLPAQAHFFRSHRDVHPDVKLRSRKNVNSLFTAYQNVDCLESYLRNQHDKGRSLSLESGDARALLECFMRMQEDNPKFYYAVDLNEEHRLRNLFWVDSKGMEDYTNFSDVVFFDTTYFTNKYKMPLVLFIGVNHHIQPTLMGCALIADETVYTFVWLMQTWLVAMGEQAPRLMLSDQINAVKAAIGAVFPGTRHCFSLWHIIEKLHVQLTFLGTWFETFMAKFNKCIFKSWSEQQFEKRWWKLVDKFNLRDIDWIQSLYADRSHWVPTFMRDISFAGLSPTSRSASLNSSFDKYIQGETSVSEFMERYRVILEDRYEEEAKANFDAWHETPELKSPSPFEKQLALVYTQEVFRNFQVEVLGAAACHLKKESEDMATTMYTVKDIEDEQNYTVEWNESNSDICCSCRSFEYKGYLCRHAIVVLQMSGVFTIPAKYILQRWTNTAMSRNAMGKKLDEVQFKVRRYNDLCRQAIILGEEGSLSQESYDVALCAIKEALKQCTSLNISVERNAKPNYSATDVEENQFGNTSDGKISGPKVSTANKTTGRAGAGKMAGRHGKGKEPQLEGGRVGAQENIHQMHQLSCDTRPPMLMQLHNVVPPQLHNVVPSMFQNVAPAQFHNMGSSIPVQESRLPQ